MISDAFFETGEDGGAIIVMNYVPKAGLMVEDADGDRLPEGWELQNELGPEHPVSNIRLAPIWTATEMGLPAGQSLPPIPTRILLTQAL